MLQVTNIQENWVRIVQCMNGRDLMSLILHFTWYLMLRMISDPWICWSLSLVLIQLKSSLIVVWPRFGIVPVTLLCNDNVFFGTTFLTCQRLSSDNNTWRLLPLWTVLLLAIKQRVCTSSSKLSCRVEGLSLLLLS